MKMRLLERRVLEALEKLESRDTVEQGAQKALHSVGSSRGSIPAPWETFVGFFGHCSPTV